MPDGSLPEERLAALLAFLPPAPEAWVEAAKQLPAARAQLDGIVARAEQDADTALDSSPIWSRLWRPTGSSRPRPCVASSSGGSRPTESRLSE